MIAASVWYRALGRTARVLAGCALLAGGLLSEAYGQSDAGGLPETIAPVQSPVQSWLQPVPYFPLATDESTGSLTIRQHTEALKPFTVAGKCGAFVGQQDGSFEAWTWPLKLLTNFRIEAHIEDYSIPIDVNEQAAEIEVAPDRTTITYSHASFTIREILFAPQCSANGTGAMAFFQIDAIRPMTLTFNFTPEVKRMWPAENPNAPSPEWVKLGPGVADGGYYLLHTDFPTLAGAIAMPGTEPGILAPYQERPKEWPLQLILHYDPARDGAKYFPLLMAAGDSAENAAGPHLVDELKQLSLHAREAYQQTADYYRHFFDKRLVAETPDTRFNQAIAWAELSIDQLRVQHGSEMGLVAGLYNSGDSTRPGFGWFFGRDALYTLYAVNSYGDFALSRAEFEFLLKRQRADGKIMHEFSQTAEDVDWAAFPYEYAAADATPLFLMAMADYVDSSGDKAFATQHWDAIAKAWEFERTHDADGDGIYDNAQGTGWVESWIPAMPKQEIYMAALDQQASQAYAKLASFTGKTEEATAAGARAEKIAATLEQEYHHAASPPAPGAPKTVPFPYAFSRNAGAGPNPRPGEPALLDLTATIYPSVAWWDGDYALKDPDQTFEAWASSEFSTDWGTRDVGEHEAIYDPVSYHQGSVWPLFTGWTSLAEYRTGRSLSGYAHLMQNLDLTWAQDLGAVTELLSGAFFQPMGRSTTHQLWSSAMVLTPALRGLFGLTLDAPAHTIGVNPRLPAQWDGATLHHVPSGDGGLVTLVFAREGSAMAVRAQAESGSAALPRLAGPAGSEEKDGVLRVPLPGAELGIPAELPLPGARTAQLKVLAQHADNHSASWLLEAQGGAVYRLPLRLNGTSNVRVEGAKLAGNAAVVPRRGGSIKPEAGTLEVDFPPGTGYTRQTVTVRW
jgi:glycogen debranching enzyme